MRISKWVKKWDKLWQWNKNKDHGSSCHLQLCNDHESRRRNLIKVEAIRECTHIKCPCARVTNPAISFVGRVTMNSPFRVGKYLDNLLCLGIAIRITHQVRGLCRRCIWWGAIDMVCRVWEIACILTINLCSIGSWDMVRWTQTEAVRSANNSPKTIYRNWVTQRLQASKLLENCIATLLTITIWLKSDDVCERDR